MMDEAFCHKAHHRVACYEHGYPASEAFYSEQEGACADWDGTIQAEPWMSEPGHRVTCNEGCRTQQQHVYTP